MKITNTKKILNENFLIYGIIIMYLPPPPPQQSLSREERKTEQVWRVFEKLEASQRRRQLLSEGSHESDPLSSPTPGSTPHPLTSRILKDRRASSSSSRSKAQLLPGVKMWVSGYSLVLSSTGGRGEGEGIILTVLITDINLHSYYYTVWV